MKLRQTHRTALFVFFILIAWMTSGYYANKPQEKNSIASIETISSVTVLNSKAVMHAKKIKISGFTEADKLVKIRAEASGKVISIPVKQGEFVKKDQLICQLYAASRTSYPKVLAPFDGYLETFDVEVGDYLNTGGICGTIIDPDPMMLVGEVAEKEITLIRVGSKATARLITGDEIEGVVSFVSTSSNPSSRTFRVEVRVDNKERKIRDGVSAQIQINGSELLAHKISPSILMLGESGELGIRTVDELNQVGFSQIEILEDTTEGIWISGLPENAKIITIGQEYVYQGQTVNVIEMETQPEA
ncbi:MAG: efflux RND transporter periplasmic adaptor subunit [Gammaproteobacteria bacterium]